VKGNWLSISIITCSAEKSKSSKTAGDRRYICNTIRVHDDDGDPSA
jgi:hypothetical protein